MKVKGLATLISESKQINASVVFDDHLEGLSDFSVSYANENHVYVTSFDSTISLYDVQCSKSVAVMKGHTKGVWTSSTNPHSDMLLSGGNDNTILLWDIKSNNTIQHIKKHNEAVYDVQFSSNGKFFASCSKGLLCLWDTANLKEPIKTIDEGNRHAGFIYCLNFIDDDTKIISGFIDGTILIYDITSNKSSKHFIERSSRTTQEEDGSSPLKAYDNAVYSLSKFKGSDWLLLAHSDGSVRIYNPADGQFKQEDSFEYFCGAVTCANTSSDQKHIVGCGKDRSGQIWPMASHNEMSYTLVGHRNIVSHCDFLRDDLVGTCSYDNSFRLWKISL